MSLRARSNISYKYKQNQALRSPFISQNNLGGGNCDKQCPPSACQQYASNPLNPICNPQMNPYVCYSVHQPYTKRDNYQRALCPTC